MRGALQVRGDNAVQAAADVEVALGAVVGEVVRGIAARALRGAVGQAAVTGGGGAVRAEALLGGALAVGCGGAVRGLVLRGRARAPGLALAIAGHPRAKAAAALSSLRREAGVAGPAARVRRAVIAVGRVVRV